MSRNSVVKNLSKNWQESYGPLKGVIFDMLVNFIKNCHAYPNCEVRNRSLIVSNAKVSTIDTEVLVNTMTTEKYYCSNEDFLLYSTNESKVITEQMVAYPTIDLSKGDAKQTADDEYAIFNQNGTAGTTQMAVEICLDHADVRLRRNIDNEPPSISGINVHLIPSCGMQISSNAIAAKTNGYVFNCDGQYFLNKHKKGFGDIQKVNSVYANYSAKVKYKEQEKPILYGAHTQFARIVTGPVKGNPNANGASNAVTQKQTSTDCLTVHKVKETADFADYFAGGPGEIHIYGGETPFDLTSA
jgi:hypothetical protein